jgi:hypothetical protein
MVVVNLNFITGVMLGIEFIEDDEWNHLVFDMLIVRLNIVWGPQFEGDE